MHQTSSYLKLKWGLTTISKNLVLQFQHIIVKGNNLVFFRLLKATAKVPAYVKVLLNYLKSGILCENVRKNKYILAQGKNFR